jgi:hypothetical protein
MLTVQYARALPGILVNAADPGFTSTDFNNHRGTQTVTEGTDAIVRLATLPPDGPTGTFQGRHGPVTWRALSRFAPAALGAERHDGHCRPGMMVPGG